MFGLGKVSIAGSAPKLSAEIIFCMIVIID